MTEDEIRELFGEMRDEPVPADSLRRVRLAVAGRTHSRSGAWRRNRAVLAAACGALGTAACVVLLALWWREPAAVPRPAPPVVARTPIEQPTKPVPPPLRARGERRPSPGAVARRQQRVRTTPTATGDLVIRIETPDPDVVILLIGD
jgi:hypothetical protein